MPCPIHLLEHQTKITKGYFLVDNISFVDGTTNLISERTAIESTIYREYDVGPPVKVAVNTRVVD
jgi:hypothetical protein